MKNFFCLISILTVLIIGCKKENTTSDSSSPGPSITGLWEVKLLTITHFDANNNVTKIDTVIYTTNLGDHVTMLEEYTSDHKYILFSNSTSDTSMSSTFSQNGYNIKINLSDNLFPFNNRTISKVDSLTMELYQIFNSGSMKQKWIQYYKRKG